MYCIKQKKYLKINDYMKKKKGKDQKNEPGKWEPVNLEQFKKVFLSIPKDLEEQVREFDKESTREK